MRVEISRMTYSSLLILTQGDERIIHQYDRYGDESKRNSVSHIHKLTVTQLELLSCYCGKTFVREMLLQICWENIRISCKTIQTFIMKCEVCNLE